MEDFPVPSSNVVRSRKRKPDSPLDSEEENRHQSICHSDDILISSSRLKLKRGDITSNSISLGADTKTGFVVESSLVGERHGELRYGEWSIDDNDSAFYDDKNIQTFKGAPIKPGTPISLTEDASTTFHLGCTNTSTLKHLKGVGLTLLPLPKGIDYHLRRLHPGDLEKKYEITSNSISFGADTKTGFVVRSSLVDALHGKLCYGTHGGVEGWFIEDFGSAYGTLYDGKKIEAHTSVPIKPGILIYLADDASTTFILYCVTTSTLHPSSSSSVEHSYIAPSHRNNNFSDDEMFPAPLIESLGRSRLKKKRKGDDGVGKNAMSNEKKSRPLESPRPETDKILEGGGSDLNEPPSLPTTPMLQLGSRKTKVETTTPEDKFIKITEPSTPRKRATTATDSDDGDSDIDLGDLDDGHGSKRRDIRDLNEKSLGVLKKFREKGKKPPFGIPALVVCYFLENKKSTATNKEVRDYICEFKGFRGLSGSNMKNLEVAVYKTFNKKNSSLFIKHDTRGVYRFLKQTATSAQPFIAPSHRNNNSSNDEMFPDSLIESLGRSRLKRATTATDSDDGDSDIDLGDLDDGHGSKMRDIRHLNEKSLGVLKKFREKGKKPPFGIPALVVCYFLENKKSTATNKEVRDYICEFKGFRGLIGSNMKNLESAVYRTFNKKNSSLFIKHDTRGVTNHDTRGVYRFLKQTATSAQPFIAPSHRNNNSSNDEMFPDSLIESLGRSRLKRATTATDSDDGDSDIDLGDLDDGHGSKMRDIRHLNEKSLGVLKKFREKGKKPPFGIPALVVCYFLENKKSTATNKEVRDYICEFKGFRGSNKKEKTHLTKMISTAIKTHASLFDSTYAKYCYLPAKAVEGEKPTEVPTEIDSRPHTVLEHAITMEDGTASFKWDCWRWQIHVNKRTNGTQTKHAICLDCRELKKIMGPRDWKIGEVQIPREVVYSIRFKGSVVKGCPWLPGDGKAPHFCRHKLLYKKMIAELKLLKRHNAKAKQLLALNVAIEEKIKAFAEKTAEKMDRLPVELKLFLELHEKVHPFGPLQSKPAFLYMLRIVGTKKPVYYGISGDVAYREYQHQIIKMFADADTKVEMVVAPLGCRTMNFVQEIETSLIRLTKAGKIFGDCKIKNNILGSFVTKNAYMKDSITNKSHPQHAQMKLVMSQLVECTMEFGDVLQVTKGLTDRRAISTLQKAQLNIATLLARIIPSTPTSSIELPSVSSPNASHSSSHAKSTAVNLDVDQLDMLASPSMPPKAKYPNACKLVEELSTCHPWNDNLLPASIYFLVSPGTEIVKRYGMSFNVDQRSKNHIWHETIKEGFNTVTIPLPSMNNRFAEDLESLFIRLSKKKLLDDGKENVNDSRDNGHFNTSFSVFEQHTGQPSTRRQFLVQSLNELISWAFISKK